MPEHRVEAVAELVEHSVNFSTTVAELEVTMGQELAKILETFGFVRMTDLFIHPHPSDAGLLTVTYSFLADG